MRCPACHHRFSIRDASRIFNPFRIHCPSCASVLSARSSFGRMLLVSLMIGTAWGTAVVVLGAGWKTIAASMVLGLGPLIAVLTRRMLQLHHRRANPVPGWHHGPGPRSTAGYAALAANLLLYFYVLGAAVTRFLAGLNAPEPGRVRPMLSILGDFHYVYLPVIASVLGIVGILSRRVAGRICALIASGSLVVIVLAPDLTIWRVLRDFGRDGSSTMSNWPHVVAVASFAVLGIALLCTRGARRYYGRTLEAGDGRASSSPVDVAKVAAGKGIL